MTDRERLLWQALDRAAYALFQVKRMGVPDQVWEFCAEQHGLACDVLDMEEWEPTPHAASDGKEEETESGADM